MPSGGAETPPEPRKSGKRLFITERTPLKPMKTHDISFDLVGTNSLGRYMLLNLKGNKRSSFLNIEVAENRRLNRNFRQKMEFVFLRRRQNHAFVRRLAGGVMPRGTGTVGMPSG